MLIVSRSGWDARPPEHEPSRIPTPTPRLWVHHTAGSEHGAAGMRSIQRYHQDTKGWNDIAYSFVIDTDGTIYEGRGAGIAGAHTEGDNSRSHAICVMGNYQDARPSTAVVESIVTLARHGRDRGWWVPTLGGHRDAPGAQTKCPGDNLYRLLSHIRERTNANEGDLDAMTETERKKLIDDISTAAALKAVAAIEQRLGVRGVPLRVKLRELAALGAADSLAEWDPEPEPEVAAEIEVPS